MARNLNQPHKALVETPPQQHNQLIPPLESGDRLNRYESERRYNTMPHLMKQILQSIILILPTHLEFSSYRFVSRWMSAKTMEKIDGSDLECLMVALWL